MIRRFLFDDDAALRLGRRLAARLSGGQTQEMIVQFNQIQRRFRLVNRHPPAGRVGIRTKRFTLVNSIRTQQPDVGPNGDFRALVVAHVNGFRARPTFFLDDGSSCRLSLFTFR